MQLSRYKISAKSETRKLGESPIQSSILKLPKPKYNFMEWTDNEISQWLTLRTLARFVSDFSLLTTNYSHTSLGRQRVVFPLNK